MKYRSLKVMMKIRFLKNFLRLGLTMTLILLTMFIIFRHVKGEVLNIVPFFDNFS
jgi:hypothetical protein